MKEKIKLLKKLLYDNDLIFVNIHDNEIVHLKLHIN